MRDRLRDHRHFLASSGIEVLDASVTGSCHYKIKVRYRDKERFFIAPYSPSDRRNFENWKADVRRWARQVAGEADGARP